MGIQFQTLPKLPVVDFTLESLKPGIGSWQRTSDEIRGALEQFGCFVAVYDNLPRGLDSTMLESMEELFNLPAETKLQNTANKDGVTYYGQTPRNPLLEALFFENATTLEATQGVTNALWPAGNDRFCETAFLFSKVMGEIAELVLTMVFEGYGVEKYYQSHVASSTYHIGFAKLLPPEVNDQGSQNHSDKSFLNVFYQNQVQGLEIETKDGQWIGFEPAPLHFLVMAGDAFMAWSNGRIHSPSHVHGVTHGKEANYTTFLSSFKLGMLQAPEELVDEKHPLLFKPFSNLEFLQYWLEEEPKNPKCSLKDYCGV